MNKKEMNIVKNYVTAFALYGCRFVTDCYKNPSTRKVKAERAILFECLDKDGIHYTVVSYNKNMFTCGYIYESNGKRFLHYETHINTHDIDITDFGDDTK